MQYYVREKTWGKKTLVCREEKISKMSNFISNAVYHIYLVRYLKTNVLQQKIETFIEGNVKVKKITQFFIIE